MEKHEYEALVRILQISKHVAINFEQINNFELAEHIWDDIKVLSEFGIKTS